MICNKESRVFHCVQIFLVLIYTFMRKYVINWRICIPQIIASPCSNKHRGSRGLGVNDPDRRLALIVAAKTSGGRASFPLSLLSSFFKTTRRVCIWNAKRTKCTCTSERQDAQRIFAGRACYSLACCPSLSLSFSLRSRTVRPFVLYLRSRRTASPFYPLSFILYPLYPGLPRQADASAPNGIMRRELVLHQLSSREERRVSFFPLVPRIAPRTGPLVLFIVHPLPSLAAPVPAFANAASFLSSSLSPRCAARPIKESRPTPVCVPDAQSSLSFPRPRPLSFRFPPYTPGRPRLVSSRLVASHLTPHLFSQASPLATANCRVAVIASRCVSPRNCISYTRPRGRMEESLEPVGSLFLQDRRMKVRRGQKWGFLFV